MIVAACLTRGAHPFKFSSLSLSFTLFLFLPNLALNDQATVATEKEKIASASILLAHGHSVCFPAFVSLHVSVVVSLSSSVAGKKIISLRFRPRTPLFSTAGKNTSAIERYTSGIILLTPIHSRYWQSGTAVPLTYKMYDDFFAFIVKTKRNGWSQSVPRLRPFVRCNSVSLSLSFSHSLSLFMFYPPSTLRKHLLATVNVALHRYGLDN